MLQQLQQRRGWLSPAVEQVPDKGTGEAGLSKCRTAPDCDVDQFSDGEGKSGEILGQEQIHHTDLDHGKR